MDLENIQLPAIVLAILTTVIITLFFVFVIINYWTNKYYKTLQFQTFGPYLQGVAAAVICIGITFQAVQWQQANTQNRINVVSRLSEEFLQPIIELFIANPEMNYYYYELLGIKNTNKYTKRNIPLENKISMLIFSKLLVPIVYIDPNNAFSDVVYTKETTKKIMYTFMQSKILLNYWTNIYKPRFAGPLMLQYMKNTFNL